MALLLRYDPLAAISVPDGVRIFGGTRKQLSEPIREQVFLAKAEAFAENAPAGRIRHLVSHKNVMEAAPTLETVGKHQLRSNPQIPQRK